MLPLYPVLLLLSVVSVWNKDNFVRRSGGLPLLVASCCSLCRQVIIIILVVLCWMVERDGLTLLFSPHDCSKARCSARSRLDWQPPQLAKASLALYFGSILPIREGSIKDEAPLLIFKQKKS
jgi:hypothetical protein